MDNTQTQVRTPKFKGLSFAYSVTLGCDPEFFFSANGQVVGSEKILPETGLKYDPVADRNVGTERQFGNVDGAHTAMPNTESRFIIDGVQAELNPRPNTCRANLGNEIGACFRKLFVELKNSGKTVGVDFKPIVDITAEELESLSEKSKQFGCAPSTNIYKNAEEAQIKVDPKKYLKRSAGGHIHLGWHAGYWNGAVDVPKMKDVLSNPEVLVPVLDLVVANTCVLLDRFEGNAERRKNYGRVGEFRLKDYGMEYRTLSNFWLRSYQLMSLVTGLCRMACHMVEQSKPDNDYVKALMDAVSRDDVNRAVQENNFELAYQNFRKIEEILLDAAGGNSSSYPLSQYTIKEFHFFVEKGLDHWFNFDSLQHWVKLPEGHGTGWESFLMQNVRSEMNGKVPVAPTARQVLTTTGPTQLAQIPPVVVTQPPKLKELPVNPIDLNKTTVKPAVVYETKAPQKRKLFRKKLLKRKLKAPIQNNKYF